MRMPHLKTHFAGVSLRNPIIVGASKLSAEIETIRQCEAAGAAAVVIHSLFEEQITLERLNSHKDDNLSDADRTRITELFPKGIHGSASGHLKFIEEVKSAVNIPVFASLNATNSMTWVEFASRMQDAGADAIEMNMYHNPAGFDDLSGDIEQHMVEQVQSVCQTTKIPITVKLSFFHANIPNLIKRMSQAGARGFVLFNRLFAPDIDINAVKHTQMPNLSQHGDAKLSERFIGMLHNRVNADFCSNTGIFTYEDVIKAILSGAQCVQMVSSLYKNRIQSLPSLIQELENWMKQKQYDSIEAFSGRLSEQRCADKFVYRRAQYIDAILHSETYKEKPEQTS